MFDWQTSAVAVVFLTAHLCSIANALIFNSTALVLAIDADSADTASYLLDGYGIGYETCIVSQTNGPLPSLETSSGGNYGLFVVVAEASDNGTSRLTNNQWESLWSYQRKYGVRMVHINVSPDVDYGTQSAYDGGCCATDIEQNITLAADIQPKEFPNAGLNTVDMGTAGLYHYPASILDSNSSTTEAFIMFQPNQNVTQQTVAGVINRFDGREQMAFFIDSGNWSETSTYLNHAWVQWGTRGLYQGYRRIHLGTQVDDLFLQTAIYTTSRLFRLKPEDLVNHVSWTYDINSRLSPGSTYFTEFGFNANGNLIYAESAATNFSLSCSSPVFTSWDEPTNLEYEKPLGSGRDRWPVSPTFDWTADCVFLDPLARFFINTTNRDAVGLVSHTFTHLELNNATYHDALREIEFNLMYAELLNFTNAKRFSGSGLIPPAITGLHNGDAIKAWADNGLWNAIGDNTRPILRNPGHLHWPLITTLSGNGYDGYQITPRFATRIYYNCDIVDCDIQQWIDTEGGVVGGSIHTLLDLERASVTTHLIGLFHDPYMFHQPNIRNTGIDPQVINGKSQNLGLLQSWVETVTAEVMRIVTWPIITLKHDHIAQAFSNRMLLDGCSPYIQIMTDMGVQIDGNANGTYFGSNVTQMTGFMVGTKTSNYCEVMVPVTVPGKLKDTKGWRVEQVGSDPMTVWVKMDGAMVEFELDEPVVL